MTETPETEHDPDRRDFLERCGRFAAVTPPAVTLLLSTVMTSGALAKSGGGGGGRADGGGHGRGHGRSHGHAHGRGRGQEGRGRG